MSVILMILLCILGKLTYQESKNISGEKKKVEQLQKENKKADKVEDGIDFKALKEQNQDVYAYIKIDGTPIDYPILQSEDGSIDYLNTTIDGKEGYPGSIYTENINSRDFHDANTVIYGHHMKDGSMFATLLNYRDPAYMEEHPDIMIYLPGEKLTYHIYAAVMFDDRYIMESYNFDTLSGRQEYLADLQAAAEQNGVLNDTVTPGEEDSLITLSTCAEQEDERFLVIGVKADEN